MAGGTACTSASRAGPTWASGSACSRRWRTIRPAIRAARRDGHPGARLRGGRAEKNGGQGAQALGRSRGGFGSKLHILADALGNPLKVILTSGAAGDNPQAIPLLDGVRAQEVIADRGYDADKTLAYIEGEIRAAATIPPKKSRVIQRACDYAAYKERHLIECLIGRLKRFRRVATRADKYARRYLAFVHLACALAWLR
jgi:transposase